jgi:hypothetical protein
VESKQESKMKKRKGKSEVIIMRKEQMMMHSISGDRSGDVFRVEMQQRNIKIPRNA